MEALEKALVSHRAIIALSVPWSVSARKATSTLKLAIPKLKSLKITFATVDEESSVVREWLNQNAPDSLRGEHARGAGSFFWVEDGYLVDIEVDGGNLTLVELLSRTHVRWDS